MLQKFLTGEIEIKYTLSPFLHQVNLQNKKQSEKNLKQILLNSKTRKSIGIKWIWYIFKPQSIFKFKRIKYMVEKSSIATKYLSKLVLKNFVFQQQVLVRGKKKKKNSVASYLINEKCTRLYSQIIDASLFLHRNL